MVYGVILAGGRSSRFNHQDKGLIQFRHRPMIEWSINRLQPQVDKLIISANSNVHIYENYGFPVVPDRYTGFQGPLMGILSAMNYINTTLLRQTTTDNTTRNEDNHIDLLVVPCDMPLLPRNLKAKLLNARTSSQQISIAQENKRLQPLVMLLPLSYLNALQQHLQQISRKKVKDWVLSNAPAICDFTSQPETFINVNSLVDLHQLEKNYHD